MRSWPLRGIAYQRSPPRCSFVASRRRSKRLEPNAEPRFGAPNAGFAMFENDDPAKRAAGFAAVDRYVRDGMCVGLGTGTTAYWAIERVGQRMADGERITAVATSSETERLCRRLEIPLVELLAQPMPVAIDGADEVAPDWSLTKGGGGALFREKAVAISCERYIVVATPSKLVAQLGRFPLPVEIVPFAAPYVQERDRAPLSRSRRHPARLRFRRPSLPTTATGSSTAPSAGLPILAKPTKRCAKSTASSRRDSSTTWLPR